MKFYFLDVFGNDRYSGNQLAVFLDYGKLADKEMQQIAREINFSETTFITSPQTENNGYPVRIFTPGSEVAFAGHPTLGTAFILQKYVAENQPAEIRLNLKAGQIPVTFQGDMLWMKQNNPDFGAITDHSLMARMLNLRNEDLDDRFPVQEVSTGLPFIIVPLKTMDALRKASTNKDIYWKFIENSNAKGILVFCPEGYSSGQDLSSRVFVDYYGIPEDPATGSATGCLAAYLVKYGIFGECKLEMTIGQGYEIGRPSELLIKAEKDKEVYDIHVGGKVIEIAAGEWK